MVSPHLLCPTGLPTGYPRSCPAPAKIAAPEPSDGPKCSPIPAGAAGSPSHHTHPRGARDEPPHGQVMLMPWISSDRHKQTTGNYRKSLPKEAAGSRRSGFACLL